MEWEADALARLEKVPFFIRARVKKQIEDYVREKGGRIVTDADVTAARRALAGDGIPGIKTAPGQEGEPPGAAGDASPASGNLTAQDLARIEELLEKGPVVEGLKSRYHEVKVCGGAAGCPRSLVDVTGLARNLARILEDSGLDRHLATQTEGPLLFHHKFRVAVAGCPNSCSQPQIVDFGVTGRVLPGRGEGHCRSCNLCVAKCQEDAVRLEPEGPVFDYTRCIGCGDCLRVCPEGAIKAETRCFQVMIGGKLGRHPRLAETILTEADETQVMAALKASVDFFMAQGRKGERFGQLLERTGSEAITAGLRQKTGA
ncbi:4Fe-4S binding protein [Neomoorella humiferrea]|uniref:Anaerobic sulfite reductase subunit C n=1 Tax=Neomoorella humiferrea TaxID=676965 RepID=A0A2T0AWH8_9FIRM|nr:4Fe-4S binding protein [Moorella humiferrea]PRR75089.1 Anaerobic sulfite reductase subunit C [Moorella humiferrea]